MPHSSTTVGVLLAAGLGTRFAAADPAGGSKLLAALPDGRPVALAAAQHLLAATPHVLAVIRPGKEVLAAVLREAGCEVLRAEAAERGMGASIAAAATHLLRGGATAHLPAAVLVALADMPWIRQDTLARMAALSRRHAVTVPVHHGKRGHPVGFAAALLPELALLDGDTGARSVVATHAVHTVECDDPGVLRDVDRPSDLPG
jgi:molybdenum cofactor cytidylyltransferase